MESEYFIYYKTNEGLFRVWSSKTETISIYTYENKPQIQCFEMINITKEYEATDESLLEYYLLNSNYGLIGYDHEYIESGNKIVKRVYLFNHLTSPFMVDNSGRTNMLENYLKFLHKTINHLESKNYINKFKNSTCDFIFNNVKSFGLLRLTSPESN